MRHVGLLPNLDGSAMHLAVNGDRVPTFDVPGDRVAPLRNVGQACEGFSRSIGAEVSVLRPIPAPRPGGTYRFYVLEPRGDLPGRWARIETIDLPGWPPGDRQSLHQAVTPNNAGPDTPWYRPGFFAAAESWVGRFAASHGIELLSPMVQSRHWTGSAVYVTESTRGRLYFKASPAVEMEGAKTETLSRLWPHLVNAPLQIDPERGWMLSAGVAGEPLSRCGTLEHWTRLMREYARMQAESVGQTTEMRGGGLEDLSLGMLVSDAHKMLTDVDSLRGSTGLTDGEHERLHGVSAVWLDSLETLARLNTMTVVEHGDLDSHQVLVGADSITILDWADSSLTVPFIGLENFIRTLHEGPGVFARSNRGAFRRGLRSAHRRIARSTLVGSTRRPSVMPRRIVEKVRRAYVDEWCRYGDRGELAPLADLVSTAFPLIRATQHWRWTQTLEYPWETQESLPDYLRRDLDAGNARH